MEIKREEANELSPCCAKAEVIDIFSPKKPSSKYHSPILIGSGGFSKVYKVLNKDDKKIYARKDLKISSEEDEIFAKREILMLSKCKHKNIIKFYEHYNVDDTISIVMELMEEQLSVMMLRTKAFPEMHAINLVNFL